MHQGRHAILNAALVYARLGLRVFPLGDRSKFPRIERWPQRATCDPAVITGWFRRWPESNLGIATGGGIMALDIDPGRGGVASSRDLFAGRKPPHSAMAYTGSEGYHYVYRVDPAIRIPSKTDVIPGLDLRGEGGQIVAAPSIHPDTRRRYAWITHPEQVIAEAPGWLVREILDLAGRRPDGRTGTSWEARKGLECERTGDAAELARDIILRFPVSGPGQRNGQMIRAVGSLLGRGYEPGLAHEAVVAWWQHYYGLGLIRTSSEQADLAVRKAIESTLRSPNFAQSRGRDHQAEIAKLTLNEAQEQEVQARKKTKKKSRKSPSTPLHPPTFNRVTGCAPLCQTAAESAFVEALLVYFRYKVEQIGELPLKGKASDLARIVEERHGLRLDPRQMERLKAKYITREGRPATRRELVVQTRSGWQGVPSEFELTGLRDLLALEGPGSPVAAPEGQAAQSPGPLAAAA